MQILKALNETQKEAALKDIAITAEGAAKDRCPVLEGHLTADIESEVQHDNGKSAAVIRIPLNATSRDYAIARHEGEYNLGEQSINKQARLGTIVGPKFITRGVDDSMDDFKDIIQEKMKL